MYLQRRFFACVVPFSVLKVVRNHEKRYGELPKAMPCNILKCNRFIHVRLESVIAIVFYLSKFSPVRGRNPQRYPFDILVIHSNTYYHINAHKSCRGCVREKYRDVCHRWHWKRTSQGHRQYRFNIHMHLHTRTHKHIHIHTYEPAHLYIYANLHFFRCTCVILSRCVVVSSFVYVPKKLPWWRMVNKMAGHVAPISRDFNLNQPRKNGVVHITL